MKALELREKSVEDLNKELVELYQEKFVLRFQGTQSTAKIKMVRRDIARIKTVLAEKTREGAK